VITDPLFKAGFTGAIKTAHLWEAYGLRCKVHGSDIACLHTALAVPSCRFFERIVRGTPDGIDESFRAPPASAPRPGRSTEPASCGRGTSRGSAWIWTGAGSTATPTARWGDAPGAGRARVSVR
jgi:hypothetical protein